MDANILLSKIVANPTDVTWSQAYSTLNLYIVLSVKADDLGKDEHIAKRGKELLEKIQREYFSESEKSLENIKKSIEQSVLEIEDKTTISIALATIAGDNLYIITVSGANVIIRRNGKVGVIAQGTPGEISAFSGKIAADDVVILETEAFAQKFPVSKLTGILDSLEVSEISENLAPTIHNEALGSEAAIILQYKKVGAPEATREELTTPTDDAPEEDHLDLDDNHIESVEEKTTEAPLPKMKSPNMVGGLFSFGGKKFIVLAIIILVVVLVGSIIFERGQQDKAKREATLSEILTPAQKKYDEATALESLNKGLALDEFTDLKKTLDSDEGKLAAGTDEKKKFDDFVAKVETQIGNLGEGGTLSNQKLIYDKGADFVEFKNSTLSVVKSDTGDVNILSADGTSTKTVATKNKTVTAYAGDDSSVYVLGDSGITKTDDKTGKTTNIIKSISDTTSIDLFGSNLYGLNTKTKTVDKYAGQASPRSDYFKGDVTLSDPTSMTIDGSIWILDSGKIRKFTKGAEDSFTVTGLTKDIDANSILFTSTDYSNIYVLGKETTRIIAISKSDGAVKNQYVSKDLSNATSFAVDETGKKIYVIISGKLYSFDL